MKALTKKNVSFIARVLLLLLLLSVCLSPLLTHTAVAMSVIPSDYATFIGDAKWFSVDAVSLTFFYGSLTAESIPFFDLYFKDADGNEHHIRRVEESYESDKYRCYFFQGAHGGMVYRHSEKIVIPKELFVEAKGFLVFSVKGTDVYHYPNDKDIIVNCYVYYRREGDMVRISTQAL